MRGHAGYRKGWTGLITGRAVVLIGFYVLDGVRRG